MLNLDILIDYLNGLNKRNIDQSRDGRKKIIVFEQRENFINGKSKKVRMFDKERIVFDKCFATLWAYISSLMVDNGQFFFDEKGMFDFLIFVRVDFFRKLMAFRTKISSRNKKYKIKVLTI